MSSNWQSYEEPPEEEEDEYDAEISVAERDNVIFAIDASLPMHSLDEEGISYFSSAVRCAASFLRTKVVQSESDLIGVMFFGTAKSENEQGFDHIYVKHDLDSPDVDRILGLEKLSKGPSDMGCSSDASLAEVFWTCSNLFSAKGQKNSTKRIFLITCNDAPHADNQTLQRNARVRAEDLADLGISIELFPIQLKDHPEFQYDAFYKDLPGVADTDEDGDVKVPASASSKFKEMEQKVLRREVKKRTAFRVPFHLFEGITLGVKGYNLVLEQKKGSYTYLDRRSNAEVQTVTSWTCASTAQSLSNAGTSLSPNESAPGSGLAHASTQMLMPSDMKSFWEYGGEKVVFTKEEVASMKHFREPGLTLLGFKERSTLKIKHNIKHSSFMYPDEGSFAGSSSIYAHLLDRLHAREKIAICRFIARSNAAPRLVALLPEVRKPKQNPDENPNGFHLIFLPFADDNRHIKAKILGALEDAAPLEMAKEIIKDLSLKHYSPSNYDNPVLQKHYANLEAIALMKDFAAEVEDKTLPKTEDQHRRAGELIKKLKEELGIPAGEEPAAVPRKRAAGDAAGGPAKKAKATGEAMSEADMRSTASRGKLNSLTIPVLSAFLLSRDIKPAKKKAEVVLQVEQALGL
ncbi:X-ray repair cross-complementing protein 6 [Thoreauomyces humboldtii]|nr:X-ray repair cross-complementing protein 6 [Thoreauomyces humboldtii]